MSGPLAGVRIVELAGLGPAPYGVMLLADLGAEVIRVDRTSPGPGDMGRLMAGCWRGRRSIALDLKHPEAVRILLHLTDRADVLVEPFRPGVAERLGVGPEVCLARNDRLVYARMTGWGQDGPLAGEVGHDLNFLAVAGVLHGVGRPDSPPVPTAGYAGDFGGGGTFLALGIVAALFERYASGRGQVVDVSVLDGATSLSSLVHGLMALGEWSEARGTNLNDGGRPYYDTYRTADGGYVAVGALEPRFYREFLLAMGLEPDDWPQHDACVWPKLRAELTDRFATATRDEWAARFAGRPACVTPVLSPAEAPHHPHNRDREVFVAPWGPWQPRPVPRLSRTDAAVGLPPPEVGAHTAEVLAELGLSDTAVTKLWDQGAIDCN